MIPYLKSIIIFICLIGILSSCQEETPKMERQVKLSADSLFQIERALLTRELDSICVQYKHTYHQSILDSIVLQRKKEILQLQQGL